MKYRVTGRNPALRGLGKCSYANRLAAKLLLSYSVGMLGCGGRIDVKQQTATTTIGKELQDLSDAYATGLLSEREYKEARKNLMKKYND